MPDSLRLTRFNYLSYRKQRAGARRTLTVPSGWLYSEAPNYVILVVWNGGRRLVAIFPHCVPKCIIRHLLGGWLVCFTDMFVTLSTVGMDWKITLYVINILFQGNSNKCACQSLYKMHALCELLKRPWVPWTRYIHVTLSKRLGRFEREYMTLQEFRGNIPICYCGWE